MATEQTITISGTPTVVSGVTVPYANTSDLEIYIGKGKIESIEVTNAGAGYTDRKLVDSAARLLVFSGGSGGTSTTPTHPTDIYTTVGESNSGRDSGTFDGKYYKAAAAGSDETTFPKGSNYTTAPNISVENFDGGTGGELTAKIYAKKTSGTDYTLSGTSGNTTITFTSALANADKVLIKRATGVSTAANTFAAGSAITAAALNKSFDQIRYKVEELPNVTSTAVTNENKGEINVSGSTWTINDDAVTGAKIADDQINSEHYIAGSIDLEHMSANSVDSDQYVDGSIDLVHMSANSVDSDQYVDGSIDLIHMSANSVDSDQYVDGSIDNIHIADNQIEEPKLKISNSPTDGQFLQYKDSSDKLTWAPPDRPTGSILETFTLPCVAGVSMAVSSGTYEPEAVTTVQKDVGTSYENLTGSYINYHPPVGTKLVVYKFSFHVSAEDPRAMGHFRLYLDDVDVTNFNCTLSALYISDVGDTAYTEGRHTIEWPFLIGPGSADASIGKVAAGGWDTSTSKKTIRLKVADYHTDYTIRAHQTRYNDALSNHDLCIPTISITAIN